VFARITRFQMKPGEQDAANAKLQELKSRILDLPGMQRFTLAVDDDGNGYVISLVDSPAPSDHGQEQIKGIWSEMAPYLAAPPEAPTTSKVLASWEN